MRKLVWLLVAVSVWMLATQFARVQAQVAVPMPVVAVPGVVPWGEPATELPPNPFAGWEWNVNQPTAQDVALWGLSTIATGRLPINAMTSERAHADARHGASTVDTILAWEGTATITDKFRCPDGRQRTVVYMPDGRLGMTVRNSAGRLITAFLTNSHYTSRELLHCQSEAERLHPSVGAPARRDDQ